MRSYSKIRFLIFIFLLSTGNWSWAQALPTRPQSYVTDGARILSGAEKARIENICVQLEHKTGVQLAVVTLLTVNPDTIEQYAVKLFEQWGIGHQGKDDGVLFLTAIDDRQTRIEVGYGLEGTLTDAMSKSIIERFVIPLFRQGDYAQGIESGTMAIVSLVAQAQGTTITGQEQNVYQQISQQEDTSFNLFSLIILAILILSFIRNPRLFLLLMLMGMGGSRRGGPGSGGSFGGGSGGFGGGMSGGGGASGRW